MIYVALLRGINVGGRNKLPMAELRTLLTDAGFDNVQTYIQSGNIVLDSKLRSESKVGEQVSKLIKKQFGFEVPVVVRKTKAFMTVAASNPFLQKSESNVKRLCVTFLHEKPAAAKAKGLRLPEKCPDKFELQDREVFIEVSKGFADTKLTNGFFEKNLGVGCTTRNWRTVCKLAEMVQ